MGLGIRKGCGARGYREGMGHGIQEGCGAWGCREGVESVGRGTTKQIMFENAVVKLNSL